MSDISSADKIILDRVQREIPFVERPFEAIGRVCGVTEDYVLSVLQLHRSLIRNISAIFNASALGYRTTLVAFSCGDRGASVGRTIAQSPCVSHCYLRDDPRYDLWFTLAVPLPYAPAAVADRLALSCCVSDYLVLDSVRQIKIGVRVPFSEASVPVGHREPVIRTLSASERSAIDILQDDLPLETRPFHALAQRYDADPDLLLSDAAALLSDGIIRRYGAVFRHRESGYSANAMTAWTDSGQKIDCFASESAVSHLYFRRAVRGSWEHPLFAMIHGRSDAELNGVIARLSQQSGITDFRVLRSLDEIKKERVRYFSHGVSSWLSVLEKNDD